MSMMYKMSKFATQTTIATIIAIISESVILVVVLEIALIIITRTITTIII